VLDALPFGCTTLVLSDHGGSGHSHGRDAPEDTTVPWILAGPTIRSDHPISASVSVLDTAPTLARVLGIEPAALWEGRCIDEVFEVETDKRLVEAVQGETIHTRPPGPRGPTKCE
jgi:arylsulfatase A-like enzyme